MREIDVNDLQRHLPRMTRRIVSALRHVLEAEGVGEHRLSVALVDDAHIRRLNRHYLDHDYATDVLSFRLDDEGDGCLSGEIVASAERACDVARRRDADPVAELLLYVVHGCLHLVGYDDRSSRKARSMHAREAELLAELGYENVFGSVADP
jgi:probable rRNA maturation factor